MNLNDASMVKQDLDKLLVVIFIISIEETIWLFLIVVISNKNGKLWICIDFQKLNVVTKRIHIFYLFTKEVFDMVVGHEVYFIFDGFTNYHQIMIASNNRHKTTFIID